jgi:hypothetical protein
MDSERTEDAVRDFLGEAAPASELRAWREALEHRLDRLRTEAAQDPVTYDSLRLKIEQTEKQIRALREEEAITGFVEETVRSAVADLGPVTADSAPHEANIPPWASLDIDDEGESF